MGAGQQQPGLAAYDRGAVASLRGRDWVRWLNAQTGSYNFV